MIKIKCEICGKEVLKYPRDLRRVKHHFCSKQCFYKSPSRRPCLGKKGENSFNWKGGAIYERGYRLVLAPNHPKAILKGSGLKYIREHRLIMEKHLGRYLRDDEIVHHIDGDITNNNIENLLLTNQKKHTKHHIDMFWQKYHKLHPEIILKCIDCGKIISKNGHRCASCAKMGNLNPNKKDKRKWKDKCFMLEGK